MFDKYHFTKQGENYIIYEAKNVDNGVQMSLYQNDQLIDSKKGLLGKFELAGEGYELKIKNSALKSTHELFFNGTALDLKSVKLKDLRKELTSANIFSAINPTQEEIEAQKFNPKTLTIPFVLMAIGFVMQYLLQDSDSYKLLPIIPEAIAGWMLFDIVADRFSSLRNLRKGRIGFMAIPPVLLGLLGEFIFPYL